MKEHFFYPNEMQCVLYSFCSPESLTMFCLQKKIVSVKVVTEFLGSSAYLDTFSEFFFLTAVLKDAMNKMF